MANKKTKYINYCEFQTYVLEEAMACMHIPVPIILQNKELFKIEINANE